MLKRVTVISLVVLFAAFQLFATGDFERVVEIAIPEADLNNGGVGMMIAGEDVDGDGKTEIYLVNNNWEDEASTEVIPRIYKLENDGTDWTVVWSAVIEPFYQNTWPCLSIADLDKDGKKELVWGPVNSTSVTANPDRIVVYEHAGGDAFGVDDGAGGYSPNSSWTIVAEDDINLRPMDWEIADVDGDGTDEIIFADRKGTSGGYYFGVCSVDNIPDNADGSETWTLETSGKDFAVGTADVDIANKWDVAVIGGNIYTFDELCISKLSWDGSAWSYTALSPMAGGSSVQSAQVVDLDGDGTKEIITAVYDWGDDTKKAVMLLKEDGDTLKHYELVNTNSYFSSGSRGLWGGASGDIDQDGYLDFVFGSRAGDVNARIFMLSYKGGDITDPASYEFSVIDEGYVAEDGIWGVINIANIDDDAELEVLYTSSASYGGSLGVHGSSAPIIILDEQYTVSDLVFASEVLLNGEIPSGYLFKPGRILDGGNTIWLGAKGSESYVFRSVDGGATFTHNAEAIPGALAQMDAFDENVALVATAAGKIFKTSNGGAAWTEVYSYSLGLGDGWFDGLRVLNANVAVAFGDEASNGDMHFVRTEDQGANWTEITGIDYLNSAYGYYTWGLGACNVGESIWCAGLTAEYDSGYVFRSYDAGVTWDSYKIPGDIIDLYPRSIAFYDDNNGMITDRHGSIIKSTDGGETWTTVTMHPNASWANGVVAVPNTNTIIVLDDNGVFSTSDLGATWEQIVTPWATSDDYFVSGVFLDEDFGYFFTDGGKVLRFEGQVVSGIIASDTKVLDHYKLHQNFPNPFNPTTTISFEIPVISNTEIIIYDLLGCEVATLVDKKLTQGKYSAVWDGRDKYGRKVSTGIYIYQLRAGNIIETKKMCFVK